MTKNMMAESTFQLVALDAPNERGISGQWMPDAIFDPLREHADASLDRAPGIFAETSDKGPQLVIAEWESEIYADLRIADFIKLAKGFGLTVGGNRATDEALSELRQLYTDEIRRRYFVVGANGERLNGQSRRKSRGG